MNTTLPNHMLEATRLTREGKLAEASALLRRALHGEDPSDTPVPKRDAPGPPPAGGRPSRTFDIDPRTGEVLDPCSSGTGLFRTGADLWSGGRPGRMVTPPIAGGLRGLLDRIAPGASPQTTDPLPQGAQFVTRSFENHAGSRGYKLYIPSTYRGEAMPLVVMLHGCTQSPDDFAAGTRMNMLAEEHGCLIAYPGQTQAANAQKCWNWFSPGDQRRDLGEPALIAGITEQVMRDHAVDRRRVYVAGLSAGGAAAAIMGMTYPDLYAAVGVHSGLACGAARDAPSAFAAMRQGAAAVNQPGDGSATASNGRPVPTIVFHGDKDGTVHPRNGEQVIAQSGAGGLRSEVQQGQVSGGHAYSRILHSDAAGQVVLEQWVVHGAGHAWSGGSSAGSYTDPRGPDASREMLRFFLSKASG
ncbi:PHB depolymerase family esterase [Roseomonas terrae]|jgi:poly(hydroxyalkanoate) depolymerase family esterase|uniref:PHB depolymerase family esterase n=1 Tax=Neoroseomonas terrae TaxID=424799 RepID=A0ABS5ECB4_9PROT|nr:PHB depolymerase family esterase [Neoroseomonas terrae]MBR0648666.1 PHB depolymerase family esterase [Neoroseomonas terrae]